MRAVVGAADARDRPHARVERAGAHRVAAAEADADDRDPVGVDLRPRGQVADCVPQVRELPGRVLVLARLALAVAEVAVVECERDEPVRGEPLGVVADDLVLDAAQRPGQRQRRQLPVGLERAVVGDPQVPDDLQPLDS